MENINNNLAKKTILLNVSQDGTISAAFVNFNEKDHYVWVAYADATEIQLENYPSIFKYLQFSNFWLELSYLQGELINASIVSMHRELGYKDPFYRSIKHSCMGSEGLAKLEKEIYMQYFADNKENEKTTSSQNFSK